MIKIKFDGIYFVGRILTFKLKKKNKNKGQTFGS